MYRFPSLKALFVFEAVARQRSFKKAADELNVTTSAVSHQVRALEVELDMPLLKRYSRVVEPTPNGHLLLSTLSDTFGRITQTLKEIQAENDETLVLSCAPTFAMRWLLPRLSCFYVNEPDIEIRLSTTSKEVEFAQDGIDVAIRYGIGPWPDFECHLLLRADVAPVCAPAYLESKPLSCSADLLGHICLHNMEVPNMWANWNVDNGIKETRDKGNDQYFQDSNLALEAALAGLGVALASFALVESDVSKGQLTAPFGWQPSRGNAYYLVYPKKRKNQHSLQRFREWLVAEAATFSASHLD